MNKKQLIFSLLFPICILVAITINKYIKVTIGQEIILPISGFDPRDILSGHFLTYRIDYGTIDNNYCDDQENTNNVYLCLKKDVDDNDRYQSSIYSYDDVDTINGNACKAVIKGRCDRRRFTADIEKFFIPEANAVSLDRAVRDMKGKIVLSITKDGNAAIKDLLIDGKSWREYRDQ